MLGASNASYCESANAKYKCELAYGEIGLTLSSKFDSAKPYNSGSVLLVPNKNIIIAVFRGTEFSSWSNLVQDVQSIDKQSLASGLAEFKPPAGVNAGKVGKGFVDAYSSIRSQFFGAMKKALKELAQANYNNQTKPKLIITGHSLGGALASDAAADLKFNTANSSVGESMASVEVWTFESPRPGDVDFALASQQHMTANQWHIENYFDLIPKLPGVDEGFAHPARYV